MLRKRSSNRLPLAQERSVVDTSEVKRALDVDPEPCGNLCTDKPSRRILSRSVTVAGSLSEGTIDG